MTKTDTSAVKKDLLYYRFLGHLGMIMKAIGITTTIIVDWRIGICLVLYAFGSEVMEYASFRIESLFKLLAMVEVAEALEEEKN